ncbi:MAG: hypothetical protein NDJ72_08495 [Elusimicrobia bacterium]|nr:hypothetical protein [Elusimicrobiota bacterium]
MRRTRSSLAAALCACFFVQSTGAADLAPVFARGMMLPPPGRMAPLPAPAPGRPAKRSVKPAGESWLASAAVVARWVSQRAAAALAAPAAVEEAPSAEALASFAAFARAQAAVVAALPAPEPPADRMLIAMEGRRVIASGLAAQVSSILQYRTGLKPLRPRFTGEWVGSGAVRARVDYLKPLGVTRGEAKGFRVTLSDGYERLLPSRGVIPRSLMTERPLYFAGDSVDVEVRVRNDGAEPLADLTVSSVQEDHTASGAPGAPTASPVIKRVAGLAPGETAVLRWRIKLGTTAREAVNFEQTHLRVLSRDPAGGEKVLLDEAQAGIVDPPGAD